MISNSQVTPSILVSAEEIDALLIEVNSALGRNVADARKLAVNAHRLAVESGYRRGELWAIFFITFADTRRNEPGCARTFRELIGPFAELEDWTGVSRTLNNLAAELLRYGSYEEPVALLKEAVEVAKAHGVEEWHAFALGHLGHVAFERQEFEAALEYLHESTAIFERAGLPGEVALSNLAGVYHAMKEYEKCEEYLLRSLKIAEDRKNLKSVVVALGNLGILAKERGEFQMAIDYQTRALQISERLEDLHSASAVLALLPPSYIALGRYMEAEMVIQKLLAYVGRSGNAEVLAQAYRSKAELQLSKGHVRRAIAELRTAEGYAFQTHVLDLQQEIASLLAKAQERFSQQMVQSKEDIAAI